MLVPPQISVIIPVYNAEPFLTLCVDSILAQNFTDFELILIDDGSADNSGKICDEYAVKDTRVIVLHKENGGVSSARNEGIKMARGKWITFIDADDYIEQGFLTIPIESQGDLLIQNYKELDENGFTSFDFVKTINPQDIRVWLDNNIDKFIVRIPWSKFFKKEIISKHQISFIEGIKIGEDTLFVFDYLCHTNSVQNISESHYIYRKPVSARRYKMPVADCLEIFHLILKRYICLGVHSVEFLHQMFVIFFYCVSPKDYKSVKLWKNDAEVQRVYTIANKQFKFSWRFRYALYPIRKKLEDIFLVPFKRS